MRPGAVAAAVVAVAVVLVAAGTLIDRTWLRDYNARLREAYNGDDPNRPWWRP